METSHLLGALVGFLAFAADFDGPGPSGFQSPPLTFQGKMDALRLFADTGDTRKCRAILADIREKKEYCRNFIRRNEAALAGIEAGISREERKPRPDGDLVGSRKWQVGIIKWSIDRSTRIQEAKEREEKAFEAAMNAAARAWKRKQTTLPDPPAKP